MLFNLILVLLIFAMCMAFLLLPESSSVTGRAPFWGVRFAHRGLYSQDQTLPENSLGAFSAAVEEGYGIELDIRLSKDGEVVVFHDGTLQRACGLDVRLDALTLAEIKRLYLFDSDQKIPLLGEALECVGGRAPLLIELKSSPRYKELCESAWAILRRYDGDICIESFDPRVLQWFKKNVPGLLRGQLGATPQQLNAGVIGFAVGHMLTNCIARPHFIAYQKGFRPLTVKLAQQLCMRFVWTVGPEDDEAALLEKNDAVIFEHYAPDPRFKTPPQEAEIRRRPYMDEQDQNREMFLQAGPSFGEELRRQDAPAEDEDGREPPEEPLEEPSAELPEEPSEELPEEPPGE